MEQKELILEAIREVCNTASEVRGSMLGALLRVRLPQVNLRDDYGGLHKFIQAECSDFLVFSHKHGGDDVFRVIDGSDTILTSDPWTAWRTFSNPTSNGELYYDLPNSRLLVGPKDTQPHGARIVPVPRITHDEQKALIFEFAEDNLSEEELRLIQRTLVSDNYWNLSISVLQSANPDQSLAFMNYRKEKLHASLTERLMTLGATESQALLTCNWLKRERLVQRTSTPVSAESRDREAILSLIRQMAPSEIDQVSIPIWVVADIMQRVSR